MTLERMKLSLSARQEYQSTLSQDKPLASIHTSHTQSSMHLFNHNHLKHVLSRHIPHCTRENTMIHDVMKFHVFIMGVRQKQVKQANKT